MVGGLAWGQTKCLKCLWIMQTLEKWCNNNRAKDKKRKGSQILSILWLKQVPNSWIRCATSIIQSILTVIVIVIVFVIVCVQHPNMDCIRLHSPIACHSMRWFFFIHSMTQCSFESKISLNIDNFSYLTTNTSARK